MTARQLLEVKMREDTNFQSWIQSITQEEGVQNIHQARVLLSNLERRQKDLNFYGIVISCFIICSIKTLYQGVTHLLNMSNPEFKIDFDVFSYVIPFISFVLDHSIKRVINSPHPEKSIWVFIKLSLVVQYLGFYVMSLEISGNAELEKINKFYVITTINLILFPLLSSLYSYALSKGSLY
mmetsp:Transcript_10866/g.18185  ORF Transcript_10866/g.18185 Transcript_10866/m.18185 type:complete len:181 (-) Transcript_10866:33-575(-)